MKKNGISSFAIVKSIKRGPSFHQQPQRWDNTSPITLFYFHVYLKYNKTKSVCFECEEKRQHLSATDDFPPPRLFSSILHQNFIIIFLHLKSRRYTTIVVGMQNRINTPVSPLSPQQPKGYWQCVVGVVWWPLLLLRPLIVFILSQFFSFLTPFFSPHFFHSFNSFIAHHLKMKACTTTTQWMNVRTMKRWLTGWSKAPLLNEWKKLREKCANLQHFN